MLKKLAIAFALILASAAAFVATRPAQFSVARSRELAAPPEVVHAYVSDFRLWPDWSPWERLDPALQREYSGEPSSPGASYAWSGNEQVGRGRMTITDSQPGQSIDIELEFLEPWAARNQTRFEFEPSGSGTLVTWTMSGERDFAAKALSLVMDMDEVIGPNFEDGLARLDAATAEDAETETEPDAAPAGPSVP